MAVRDALRCTVALGGLAVFILSGTLTACSSDGDPTSGSSTARSEQSKPKPAVDGGTAAAVGTYEVGHTERTYIDTSRPTTAHGGQPELASRTLDALVLYPAESAGTDTTPVVGRWPMIVFSHGSTRAGIDYVDTLSFWVSAGYVVVAPNYPLSKTGTPGGTAYGDYESQTGDVSFVIDSVLADAVPVAGDGPALSALVDPNRIGAGGQSFGAITTIGAVAAACCADERIAVATEFAGTLLPFSSGTELDPHAGKVPILFVHGSEDPTIPYDAGRSAWETIGAPGGFLTLVGSGHDDGFFGGGSTELDRLVSDATLAFYDAVLRDDSRTGDRADDVQALVDEAGAGVARFEVTPS